jgi:hypothetical protein
MLKKNQTATISHRDVIAFLLDIGCILSAGTSFSQSLSAISMTSSLGLLSFCEPILEFYTSMLIVIMGMG